MKLLVSWMRELGTYVSREFHYVMLDLVRVHGWRHVEPWMLSKHAASGKAGLVDWLGEVPEVILFWETYDLFNSVEPALHEIGCRLILFADDLHMLWGHESKRESKLQALAGCDKVLTPYAYVFDKFYPELLGVKAAVWIPHSASPDFILPTNHRPRNAILLSGFIGTLYPLRARMKELQQAGLSAIAFHEHPGYRENYDYDNDDSVGVGYARTIHSYKAGFTDAGVMRYIVAKYFEIPATGALLVADGAVSHPLRQLGFIENRDYVPVSANDLEQKVQHVLADSNSAEIDAIRVRGQQLVWNNHRTCHRAKLIDDACAAANDEFQDHH